jgi:hypothetical protein
MINLASADSGISSALRRINFQMLFVASQHDRCLDETVG